MAENKTLVRFNVQNIKYAVKNAKGGYDTPVPYGTATKMALQSDSSTKIIYGDGRRLCVLANEKGKSGTMTTNNVSDDYEIAMGRKIRTAGGLAEIKETRKVEHAIYFETCGMDSAGSMPIAKTWLFGVTSSRPAESFDQNTEDVNESTFETALEMIGTGMLAADGKPYLNPVTGMEVTVWQMTVTPEDSTYKTFGDAVPTPKMGA